MEIQYRSHIKDRNGVTFIAIINPVPNILSPIEPYIYDENGNMSLGGDLTKVICGNKEDCKIVSMRLYDERCAEDDGSPIICT